MKVTTEPRENRQLALTIEVEPERVEAALAKAAKSIARKANIPGFRKGKAPRHIIEQMFGKDALINEALDELGKKVYVEALEQEKIEPYGPGHLEDIQNDPLVLRMLVPLAPKVELGDYRSLRVPFEAPAANDDEVAHQIEHLRERHAIIEPAPEGTAADWGHVVTLDIDSAVEGEAFIQEKSVSVMLAKEHLDDAVQVVSGFEKQIVGMKSGDEKSFSLLVPNDDAYDDKFKGKHAEFKVMLNDLKIRTLPDADDALAQTVGDFETIDALRDAIRKDIAGAKRREAEATYVDRAIDKLLETAQVEFPPLLVDGELDAMLERTDKRLRDQGLSLEQYLKTLSKTRDEYRQELSPTAEGRLKRGLLLSRIVDLEQLDVDESEVAAAIETTSAAYGQRADRVRDALSSNASKQSLRLDLLTQKAIDRLTAIAKGEAPEIAQPASEPV